MRIEIHINGKCSYSEEAEQPPTKEKDLMIRAKRRQEYALLEIAGVIDRMPMLDGSPKSTRLNTLKNSARNSKVPN